MLLKLMIRLIILISCTLSTFAQTKNDTNKSYAYDSITSDTIDFALENQEIPKIHVGNIVGQTLLGTASGMIFGIGGGYLGSVISSNFSDISTEGLVGLLVGYCFGSALGVYVAAGNQKYDPNFIALIGSSFLGEIVGIILYSLSQSDTHNANALAFAPLVLPPVFAIISLNSFQQKKSNITVGFNVQQLPQPNAYSCGVKLQYTF